MVIRALLMLLLLAAVMLWLAGQLGLLKGQPPDDLGVHEGRLKAPSRTENSVSSQADLYPDAPMRAYAQIAAFPVVGDGPQTLARLARVIEAQAGARLVQQTPDYLYAQFETRRLKFVDDVEFWFSPAEGVIHVRSASRLGRKDFGVNRARVERLRQALQSAL